MTTTIAAPPTQFRAIEKPRPMPRRSMTLHEFRRTYSRREDGYKYEFSKGEIIKTSSAMKINQFHIVNNLYRRFLKTTAFANGDALGSEVEQITLPEHMRKPDLCYIRESKLQTDDESVSDFVVEIISPSDSTKKMDEKLLEYFDAGVKVVWQIRPWVKHVYVYTSPTDVKICKGGNLCSAAPVLDDFEMTADEVFWKKL